MNKETKYIAYLRVSTQKQGFSGLGLEAQNEIIQNHLRDIKPIAEYIEIESGRKTDKDRPELRKALEHCRKEGANLIVAEPTELIGTGTTSDSNYVIETIKTVNEINPDIMVLQGAGISNGQDVYNTIKLGAQATGSTSGIIKAADPYAMVEEMLFNLRKAWDEMNG